MQTESKSYRMITSVLAVLFVGSVEFKPALAAPSTDYFAINTKQKAQTKSVQPIKGKIEEWSHTVDKPDMLGPLAMMSGCTPIVTWFESFDEMVATFRPSEGDRVILSRPFNQQAQRVEQWTEVARKISKNYRLCSQTLKKMRVPDSAPGVKDYRDLTADWYLDVATVYEDLIKPRPPARTMEELEDALNEVKGRAQSLAKTSSSLKAMDLSLRKQFKVHLSRQDDALQQYVRGK